ncbi:MAG: response regulator [candidate division Zixibacteria bacterium]|nr:response regulator [candidate division Zixibacteria bacterium]
MLNKSNNAILLVEDDESIRDLMVNIMIHNKYVPMTASCSEDALEIIKANEIDLAVINYGLPTDDGVTLAKKIEAIKPGLPTILMSGLNVKNSDCQIREAGINDVIQKPSRIENLLDKVRHSLASGVKV